MSASKSTRSIPMRDPDLLQVGAALRRAARRARQLARQTGTPFYIWRDDRIVNANAQPGKRKSRAA